MAAVAHGIGEKSSAVQLMAFLGKYFRICLLKVQLYVCICLFLYCSIYIFFTLLFFSAGNFSSCSF